MAKFIPGVEQRKFLIGMLGVRSFEPHCRKINEIVNPSPEIHYKSTTIKTERRKGVKLQSEGAVKMVQFIIFLREVLSDQNVAPITNPFRRPTENTSRW